MCALVVHGQCADRSDQRSRCSVSNDRSPFLAWPHRADFLEDGRRSRAVFFYARERQNAASRAACHFRIFADLAGSPKDRQWRLSHDDSATGSTNPYAIDYSKGRDLHCRLSDGHRHRQHACRRDSLQTAPPTSPSSTDAASCTPNSARSQHLCQIANCRRELHHHANANRGRDGFVETITDEPHHVISQGQVIEVDAASPKSSALINPRRQSLQISTFCS